MHTSLRKDLSLRTMGMYSMWSENWDTPCFQMIACSSIPGDELNQAFEWVLTWHVNVAINNAITSFSNESCCFRLRVLFRRHFEYRLDVILNTDWIVVDAQSIQLLPGLKINVWRLAGIDTSTIGLVSLWLFVTTLMTSVHERLK